MAGKKEPGFEWLLPEERGGSGPTLCLLGFTQAQGPPDSTAAGRHQRARVGGFVGIRCGSTGYCAALVTSEPDAR